MALIAAGLTGGQANAADRYWSGSGFWNTTDANWGTTAGGPYTSTWNNANNDAAILEGTAGVVTVTASATASGMTFNTTGYSVTSGTIAFRGGGTITLGAGVSGTIASKVTGPGSLVKSGQGVLRFSSTTNDFSGTLEARGGVIEVAVLPSSNKIIFNSGTVRSVGSSNVTTSRQTQIGSSGGGRVVAQIESSGAGTINLSSTSAATAGGALAAGSGLRLGGTNTGNNFWRGTLNDLSSIAIALTKTNAGTWIVTGNSGYSGGTTISSGTLGFGNTNALGTGTVSFSDNATLRATVSGTLANAMSTGPSSAVTATIDTQANALTLSGVVGGAGNLKKIGAAMLTLTGTSTYTGGTSIAAGRLVVNGALGDSAVTMESGTELGGSGAIGGPVTVSSGATLAPGNSIESLVTGTATFAAGATFAYEVDSTDPLSLATAADLLVVDGDLDLDLGDGTLLTITDVAGSPNPFVDGTTIFAVANYFGSWNGGLFTHDGSVLADDSTFTVGSQQWTIDYDRSSSAGLVNFTSDYLPSGRFVTLTAGVVPVPEIDPAGIGSVVALVGASLGLLERRRRRGVNGAGPDRCAPDNGVGAPGSAAASLTWRGCRNGCRRSRPGHRP